MILNPTAKNAERTLTNNGIRVFVYGSLKRARSKPEAITGKLYLRPNGTAAADFTDRSSKVWGEVILVTPSELISLDIREGAACAFPWYSRILAKTRSGIVCWTYQWERGFNLEPLESGVWSWEHLKTWRGRYSEDLMTYQKNAKRNPAYLRFLAEVSQAGRSPHKLLS